MDHRTGLLPGHQGPVGLISPVGEHLAGHPQARLPASLQQLAARQAHKDDVFVHLCNALRNSQGQLHVLGSHVVQRPVGLAVLELHPLGLGKGHEGPQLVLDVGLDLLGGAGQVPASEAHEIGVAGVGPHRHPGGLGGGHGLVHHQGVSGVIAAGHIGGGHIGDDLAVQTDSIGAEALPQIAVQVYFIHRINSSFADNRLGDTACSRRRLQAVRKE